MPQTQLLPLQAGEWVSPEELSRAQALAAGYAPEVQLAMRVLGAMMQGNIPGISTRQRMENLASIEPAIMAGYAEQNRLHEYDPSWFTSQLPQGPVASPAVIQMLRDRAMQMPADDPAYAPHYEAARALADQYQLPGGIPTRYTRFGDWGWGEAQVGRMGLQYLPGQGVNVAPHIQQTYMKAGREALKQSPEMATMLLEHPGAFRQQVTNLIAQQPGFTPGAQGTIAPQAPLMSQGMQPTMGPQTLPGTQPMQLQTGMPQAQQGPFQLDAGLGQLRGGQLPFTTGLGTAQYPFPLALGIRRPLPR